jgi:multisubunit Na+/H+ antiporter MnhB subunit
MKHLKTILAAAFGLIALIAGIFTYKKWNDRNQKKTRYALLGLTVVAIAAIPVTTMWDRVKFWLQSHKIKV